MWARLLTHCQDAEVIFRKHLGEFDAKFSIACLPSHDALAG